MSGFGNPIVGALGRLIRQAIQSANFVAGSLGWRIAQDGSAEFSNATIRGVLEADGPNGSYVRVDTAPDPNTAQLQAEILMRPPSNTWVLANYISPAILRSFTGSPVSDLPFSSLQLDLIGPRWATGSGAASLKYPVISLRTAIYSGGDPVTITVGSDQGSIDAANVNISLGGNTLIFGLLTLFAGMSVSGTSEFANLVRITSSGIGAAFRAQITGDVSPRFEISSTGQLLWGTGAGAGDTNLKRQAANILRTDDALEIGDTLRIDSGANCSIGRATLVAGTVVVNTNKVTAASNVFLTCQTPGGTPGFLRVSARTAATSFTILSSNAADTSVVGWLIVEPI